MPKFVRKYDLEFLKQVLVRHSRVKDAEKELELKPKTIVDTFRKRGLSAAAFLGHVRVPEGHEVKSVTTLEDAAGNVRQRSIKTQQTDSEEHFEPVPPDHAIKGLTTALGPSGDVRWQWVKTRQDEAERWAKFWKACEEATTRYRGVAGAGLDLRNLPPRDADLLTIYNLGDPHIGLLAWANETGAHFDTRIAERELFAVVDALVERSPPARTCVLANLGDFFHAQNDKQLTPTGGNKLDVDGRMVKVTEIGFMLFRRLIDRCREKHERVLVAIVPGNHDPDIAYMLALWIKAVYENVPEVEVLGGPGAAQWSPYKYLEWGKNLFGWCHGDGAKVEQLAAIMAVDMCEAWGRTTHHYWHTGHRHHLETKEFPGCVVETHRTVAANDGWHNWRGYRAGKSLSAITYHIEGGTIGRVEQDLALARKRIAASVGKTA